VTDTSDTGTDAGGNPITDPEGTETPNGDGTTNGDPTDDPTVTTIIQNAAIGLIKTGIFNDLDGDGCSNPNETISYTFTVTNEGNISLSNVELNDILLGGLIAGPVSGDTNADMILDIDEIWNYEVDYMITQLDIDAGNVTNTATVTADGPTGQVSDVSDESIVSEDDPTVTVLCQDASIALLKVGTLNDQNGNGCTDVLETIDYQFIVINTGNVTLTNITVTDANIDVILLGGPIATLAPGDQDDTTITGVYSIQQVDIDAGSFTNTATVFGTTPDATIVNDISDETNPAGNNPTVTTLCQNDSIALIKTGTVNDTNGDGCANVDETITYSFSVINNGNTTITNIDIDDPLVNVQGGPIVLNPGDQDTTSFTAVYLVTQANINDGQVTNQAEVTGLNPAGVIVSDLSDNNDYTQNDPTVTVLCNQAVIALIKTGTPVDENNNGCVDLGETIIYDFVVTNLGNVTLTQVIVTDPMVTVIGGPVTLLAGESDTETFSAIYTVIQDDVNNGFVNNQAIAEGLDAMGNIVSDLSDNNSNFENDITTTILCQDSSIAVEKTGIFIDGNSNGITEVGELIEYTFFVTNTGNVTLFNITLDDPLPGIVVSGGPIAQLLPGEVDNTTFTATYPITQQDIDNGEVVNQATVSGKPASGSEITDLSDDPTETANVDLNGDGNPDDPTVTILPNVDAPFIIFNAVSPDGNGQNDIFLIQGISEFPDNNVKIYNRWGVLVFETDGYGGSDDTENVFVGISEGRETIEKDKLLPTGTYYYIIKFNGDNPGEDSYAGYLYLNR
ncbi:gliding motility-associated C-terminal domain-containing protein, partial [Patiriisocius marinistellae]|uniref:gliding motility-associated C-terminal domain-containing protein n=1 Tax=Patiriisocius marinistellae TaxID=2494560 RepID=UPI001561D455